MSDDDTSYLWAGMQRVASESLIHSCRTSDPDEALDMANKAIAAGQDALKLVSNQRQTEMTSSLLGAAHLTKSRAERAQRGDQEALV